MPGQPTSKIKRTTLAAAETQDDLRRPAPYMHARMHGCSAHGRSQMEAPDCAMAHPRQQVEFRCQRFCKLSNVLLLCFANALHSHAHITGRPYSHATRTRSCRTAPAPAGVLGVPPLSTRITRCEHSGYSHGVMLHAPDRVEPLLRQYSGVLGVPLLVLEYPL